MVDAVAKSAGITKKAGAAVLEALVELIAKDLKKGNNVVITGFGTFRVSKRAARTGVNPRPLTGGYKKTASFLQEAVFKNPDAFP